MGTERFEKMKAQWVSKAKAVKAIPWPIQVKKTPKKKKNNKTKKKT